MIVQLFGVTRGCRIEIIICFISLFVDVSLFTLHLFGCWYYSKVLKQRKEEEEEKGTGS